ncbi:exopolysaccharide biosynthesis protein [Candidatus Protochlamydia phocaeensis]|uniref:exopolysaccharide biosynthesis protein n=1 Tax=Candidatus Protochlamydia phocaeensis TaxID=1414722 RepID=UPI000837BA1A|nr:exopolysaccharide biosynthesis protein [Candidatus Protochlamydia phocaeensis]
MSNQKSSKLFFLDSLQQILMLAQQTEEIKIEQMLFILAEKGYAALLILLSLPFCLPVQIPGFSTPFGLLLALIGLRMAFGKSQWWPQWILIKSLKSQSVITLAEKAISIVKWMQKILHPRLIFLTRSALFSRLNGLVVFVLSLFLSLPLPIPLTNLMSAVPLFCMGLGLLEDDGLMILVSYVLSLLCLLFFTGVFLFSFCQIKSIF